MGACCSTDATASSAAAAATNNPNPVAAEKTLDEAEKVPLVENDRACFGAGCYWGTEKFFYHDFGKKNTTGAISDAAVGFMGPEDAPVDPTYAEVKGGYTKHVEVFEFAYTGGIQYYEALVRFFFQFHDPTTLKRQGNDVGTQYASVIFCYTDAQEEVAKRVKAELQALLDAGKLTCFENKTVTTDIRRATKFYPAHKEHQDYLTVNPDGYCNHRIRFAEWPKLDAATTAATAAPEAEKKVETVEEPTKEEEAPLQQAQE